jgi:hypothetical protein
MIVYLYFKKLHFILTSGTRIFTSCIAFTSFRTPYITSLGHRFCVNLTTTAGVQRVFMHPTYDEIHTSAKFPRMLGEAIDNCVRGLPEYTFRASFIFRHYRINRNLRGGVHRRYCERNSMSMM